MRKLLPVLVILLGSGAGIGAGLFLRPVPAEVPEDQAEMVPDEPAEPPEYVKLNNQFVIPVLEDGRIEAMVILSINLEVAPGSTETVFAHEPKLRDAFLQVLFDHANAGGFRGSFTDGANLINLRSALKEVAVETLGEIVKDILIVDIGRQDS
jgi:flagellar protein FliL